MAVSARKWLLLGMYSFVSSTMLIALERLRAASTIIHSLMAVISWGRSDVTVGAIVTVGIVIIVSNSVVHQINIAEGWTQCGGMWKVSRHGHDHGSTHDCRTEDCCCRQESAMPSP